ncbi:hypothetical protein E4U53_007806 [Claviceps sorghi]|nr:hypothetical protein E4U53_007806 [Claviceps sorghi]
MTRPCRVSQCNYAPSTPLRIVGRAKAKMSGILRSKQGCWTCRLRKKKCDEGRPQCSSCESLRITCHGYGPKPQWMDSGEREQAMIEDFKRRIRTTARQKRPKSPLAARRPDRRQHRPQQPVLIAMRPEVPDSVMGNHDKDSSDGSRAGDGAGAGTIIHSSATSDTSAAPFQHSSASASPATRPSSSEGWRPDSEASSSRHSSSLGVAPVNPRESMLLMHFLDQVIPAQYPLYRPQPLDGGRGWLLSLLLHSKSLFHGALALSSYHRLISILAGARPACRALAAARHQQHLESCLREVRWTMQEMTRDNASAPDFAAGTLMSVVQLVLSEAFTGDADAWRMHLCGATEMYRCAMEGSTRHARQTEEALAILRSNIPLEGEAAGLCEDVASMRFISSAVLWLDILGSVTKGSEPRLLSTHPMDLGPASGIRLDEVMGCQNLVMAQIARISALHAALGTHDLDSTTRDLQVADIQEALRHAQQQILPLLQEEHEPQRKANTAIAKVSRVFHHAATIYLHLVTKGFRDRDALQRLTGAAVAYLRTEITPDLTAGLVCPLFVIGCAVARSDDQELFRTTFSSHQFLNPLFKQRTRLLPILEEIWGERWKDDYSWSNVVRLSSDVLLV